MNRLTPILCLCLLLSSCGLFKSTTRTRNLEQSSTQVTYKRDSVDLTVDRSTITTTEKADTAIVTKSRTYVQATTKPVTQDSLYHGMTTMVNDLLTVTLKLDSVTGILNTSVELKPETLNVKFDKTRVEQRDLTKSVVTGENIKYSKDSKAELIVKEKKPSHMGIWLIVAIIVICGAGWWINKRLF